MFRTKAEKTSRGNYNVATTCQKGHTSFKKAGGSGPWECPYCGLEVP